MTNHVDGFHYKVFPIEPYQYAMVNKLNPYQFNVVKYVTRYKHKNGIDDLRKAIRTLEMLIKVEEQDVQERSGT